jgi:hypothetical protein
MNEVGLQFATFFELHFLTGLLTDAERLVLQGKYFSNQSARLLQKRIYVAPNCAEGKTNIKII